MGATVATRRGLRVLLLSFLLTALLRLQAEAFYVQVDAHDKECFFEQGRKGATMTLSFEVRHGGFLDIDVEIRDPDNILFLRWVGQKTGRYTFPVHLSGRYQFCFINPMSTLTPKEVMFKIDPGQAPATSIYDEQEPTKMLAEMIRELGVAIRAIKREQQHMEVLQKTHRVINENTNRMLTMWAFFEAVILVIMTFGQIYYLRNFFQDRRPRTQVNTAT